VQQEPVAVLCSDAQGAAAVVMPAALSVVHAAVHAVAHGAPAGWGCVPEPVDSAQLSLLGRPTSKTRSLGRP
jgi:hypothetical protein